MDLTCLPASLHNRPERIPGAVAARIRRARADGYDRIFVAYADCGTGGLLDRVLEAEGVARLEGAHCYEVYAGRAAFAALSDEEPGTFYLTDFLVRNFDRLVIRGLGLDRHPGAPAAVLRQLPPTRLPRPDRRRGPRQEGGNGRGPPRAWRSSAAWPGSASSPRRSQPSSRSGRPARPPDGAAHHDLVARHPDAGHRARGPAPEKRVLDKRFQIAVDKAAMKSGKKSYGDYIEEMRRAERECGADLEAEANAEVGAARGRVHEGGPADAGRGRRRGRATVTRPRDHPHRRQLGDARGRHRLRPAVHDHRRAHQPDRSEAPGRGDEGRRLQPRRARRGRPGRGGRAHARRERGHPARRRAGDPRPDDPARAVAGGRAALDRLVDRRGARGRPRRLPGQAARELRDRRGGAARTRAPADQALRRRGRRDLERRHRHLRGPRRAVRGRAEDRGARRGLRDPAGGRDRRPARHADRRDGDAPASRSSGSSAGCARSSA